MTRPTGPNVRVRTDLIDRALALVPRLRDRLNGRRPSAAAVVELLVEEGIEREEGMARRRGRA